MQTSVNAYQKKSFLRKVTLQQISTVVVPAFHYILSGSGFAQTECSNQPEIDSTRAL